MVKQRTVKRKIRVKKGRPTNDPCGKYVVFIPESYSKIIKPQGLETRSKRICYLIMLGAKVEARRKK